MFANLFPSIFPLRDPILIFAIVLLLFLLAPIVMARFKLPGMIGILLAGAILGPHSLGILARDSSFILLGSVGLIYIMFTAALEVDLSVFKKHGVNGFVFGLLTFSFPQTIGTFIAYYILGFDLLASILLACMIASHTLLAYPIASKFGLSANRAVIATIGGTMVTDTIALLVLAVIAATAQGEASEAMWWRLGFSMLVFVSAIFLGLPRLGRWFFRKAPDDDSAQFVFVLSTVFLCAALSHFVGLEPIVGAFLAGLALNRLIPHNSTLMNRLNFTGEAIFIPFFLLSVGMILDATVLFGSLKTWAIAIGVTFSAISGKWLAAKATGFIFGYKKDEVQIMFGISVVQAAATLATVMVGHRIGMFDDAVVNGTIIMILITCILSPYMVHKHSAKLAKDLEAEAPEIDKDSKKNDKILVPLMNANDTEDAIELSLVLRDAKSKDPIYPAFIVSDDEKFEEGMALANKILNEAVEEINAANCPAEAIKRVDVSPGQALIRIRKETGASKVIMPWDATPSKHGAKFGYVIDELIRDGKSNVILSRLVHSLSGSRRLNIVFPPIGGQVPISLIQSSILIERIAKELGLPIQVFAMQSNVDALKQMFRQQKLALNKSFVTYPSNRMWFPFMIQHTSPEDLIVLVGAPLPNTPDAPQSYVASVASNVHNDSSPDTHETANLMDSQLMAYSIVGRYSQQNILIIFGAQEDVLT